MNRPVQPEPLVLASASPRRIALLREAGYRFEVLTPIFDEPVARHPSVVPSMHAEALAYFKARSVAALRPDAVILAADTICVVGDEVVGKPADRDDARRILRLLSGTTHRVITGLAVLDVAAGRRLLQHESTTLHMRELSRERIEAYLDTGEWQGKAGAYGIQDHGDAFVDRLEGSFSNVVGLPTELVARVFARWCAAVPVAAIP